MGTKKEDGKTNERERDTEGGVFESIVNLPKTLLGLTTLFLVCVLCVQSKDVPSW